MTNMSTEIMDELNSMEDLIDQADSRRRAELDMSIPVGAELGSSSVEAGGARAKIVQTKQDSLARTANGTILPGRTPVYYRLGHNSIRYVDTGRLAHHLSKRVNGERVFSLKPWPNMTEQTAYEKICDLCANGPQPVTKRFIADENGDGETKYIAHMTTFHGMQWQTILRQEERDERRDEQALLRQLVERIGGGQPDSVAVDVEALVQARLKEIREQERLEGLPPPAALAYQCECGAEFKNAVGLNNHRRLSKKHKEPVAV